MQLAQCRPGSRPGMQGRLPRGPRGCPLQPYSSRRGGRPDPGPCPLYPTAVRLILYDRSHFTRGEKEVQRVGNDKGRNSGGNTPPLGP